MWQKLRPSDDRRDTGSRHLQARDAQGLEEAKGTLPWGLQRVCSPVTPGFWTSGPKTEGGCRCCWPAVCGSLQGQPSKVTQLVAGTRSENRDTICAEGHEEDSRVTTGGTKPRAGTPSWSAAAES